MYHGGDIAERLLTWALVAAWRPEQRVRTILPTGGVRAGVATTE
ncbi:hypothetical protein GCM10023100_06470 [Actinocorallia cavernae]|uniref:Uncharacterized protein n=2 Tax=Actinomycetes TaxID=1760 RepID=A0ABN3N3P8_9ACTN